MKKIGYEDVLETEPFKFCAEASDLDFPVGEWPNKIETTIGNGMSFVPVHKEVRDGDLMYVRYAQIAGCVSLTIFND